MTVITTREFAKDHQKAREAATRGPVFITEDGKATHVILSIDDFIRLHPSVENSLADRVSMDVDDDIDFEPERIGEAGFKIPDFR
jgi:PHD/YefM family antitoxin component YafN of YafNO toxin-antitoxin module